MNTNRLRGSILLSFLFLLASLSAQDMGRFSVKDFGAEGVISDTATLDIQAAIDRCHEAGGGQVYFPPGDYVSGTIVMKSNVSLYLEAGARLLASRNPKDFETEFIVYKKNDSGKEGDGATPVFIYAKDAENISILGSGTIDGQATRTYDPLKKVDGFISDITENARQAGVEMKMYYKVEPYTCLIFLESCKNVRLRDVSLLESVDWTLHFKWCERIFVDNIYLFSSLEAGVNADGIDVDGCTDVVIQNCIIRTGDDAIVLKSTNTNGEFYPCENVTVSNCVLESSSTALKLGTESFGDFRFINFNNCVIRKSNRGLSVVVRDGATVEHLQFTNMTLDTERRHFNWWGNADPIWLVVKKRFPHSKLGKIKDVVFENIKAVAQGTSKLEGFAPTEEHPEGSYLENIVMRNVQIRMEDEEYADKRADDGFSAHHVRGLRLEALQIDWDQTKPEKKWRHALSLAHVEDFYGENWQLAASKADQPIVSLNQVQSGYVDRVLTRTAAEVLIEVKGDQSRDLVFSRLDGFQKTGKGYVTGKECQDGAVRVE